MKISATGSQTDPGDALATKNPARANRLTQADIVRAIRAVEKAGKRAARMDFDGPDKFTIHFDGGSPSSSNPWDEEFTP